MIRLTVFCVICGGPMVTLIGPGVQGRNMRCPQCGAFTRIRSEEVTPPAPSTIVGTGSDT